MAATLERAKTIASTLVLAGLVVGWAGCKGKDPPPIPVWKSGTTVIPGNAAWDAETDGMVHAIDTPSADLWWEMVSEAQRYLTPCNGAGAAVVKRRSYEEVTGRYLQRWHMPGEKLSGSDEDDALEPGTVIAFRTAEGTVGKLRIVGFRPLHDLSFPEAGVYPEAWKAEAAKRPNYERYHIEIEWTLFQP